MNETKTHLYKHAAELAYLLFIVTKPKTVNPIDEHFAGKASFVFSAELLRIRRLKDASISQQKRKGTFLESAPYRTEKGRWAFLRVVVQGC